MFIHGFDGPWIDHPFWLPRFLLSNPADLARIRDSDVPAVVIDERRGVSLGAAASPTGDIPGAAEPPLRAPDRPRQHASSFAAERTRAAKLVHHATGEMKRLFAQAGGRGQWPLNDVAPIATGIIDSVERHPHALIAITRLKDRDHYTYVHSIAVSALMTSFARRLKMTEAETFEFTLAGLLHDIGKMVVPPAILNKPASLTDHEFALVRTHPEQGYRLLGRNAAMPPVILDVCRHHHERLDGSGYPLGLKRAGISRPARVAAICDVYDALTSDRAYKRAWTPQDAVRHMYEASGHFDHDLLFAFMKAIGVYPAGLLVQLRSNRLGITLPVDNRVSGTRVRAFFCMRERVALPPTDVLIEDDLAHDQIIAEEYPLDWGITEWPAAVERLTGGTAEHRPRARHR